MTTESTDAFAVEWDDPADAATTWRHDRMHSPEPLPPLAHHFLRVNNEVAFGGRTVFVNGYPYSLMAGPPMPSPDLFSDGLRIWTEDYVVRLDRFCRRVLSRDYDAMPAPALVEELDRLAVEAAEHFKLTMVVVIPLMAPTYEVIAMAEAALGDDGARLVGQLLQEGDNATSTAGLALGELAERARGLPDVAAALRRRDFDGLAAVPGGDEFLTDLRAFLDVYGWRLETWSTMHVPTWAEDPTVALGLITRYLEDGGLTPRDAVARASHDREAARVELEARVDSQMYDRIMSGLDRVKGHVPVSESRAHWQLMIFGVLRRPIGALAGKLEDAGILEAANDIYYLYWDEVRAAANSADGTLRTLVASRRRELDRWRSLTPPPFVGAPPLADTGPAAAFVRHFFGAGVEPSAEERVVTGIGGSRGTFTGRARVIANLAESERLEPGDVLVCATTAAPWTPLFAVAGAVVTDTGGVLSHSAICAREYAIPAVVGTQVGTKRIPDGAMVTVDGEKGTVRIEG